MASWNPTEESCEKKPLPAHPMGKQFCDRETSPFTGPAFQCWRNGAVGLGRQGTPTREVDEIRHESTSPRGNSDESGSPRDFHFNITIRNPVEKSRQAMRTLEMTEKFNALKTTLDIPISRTREFPRTRVLDEAADRIMLLQEQTRRYERKYGPLPPDSPHRSPTQ